MSPSVQCCPDCGTYLGLDEEGPVLTFEVFADRRASQVPAGLRDPSAWAPGKASEAPSSLAIQAVKATLVHGRLEFRRKKRTWRLTSSEVLWVEQELTDIASRLTARIRAFDPVQRSHF